MKEIEDSNSNTKLSNSLTKDTNASRTPAAKRVVRGASNMGRVIGTAAARGLGVLGMMVSQQPKEAERLKTELEVFVLRYQVEESARIHTQTRLWWKNFNTKSQRMNVYVSSFHKFKPIIRLIHLRLVC